MQALETCLLYALLIAEFIAALILVGVELVND